MLKKMIYAPRSGANSKKSQTLSVAEGDLHFRRFTRNYRLSILQLNFGLTTLKGPICERKGQLKQLLPVSHRHGLVASRGSLRSRW
jgi:hypothetical protein